LSSELRNNQHFHNLDWNVLEDYMSYLMTKLIRGYSSIPSVGAARRRGVERLLLTCTSFLFGKKDGACQSIIYSRPKFTNGGASYNLSYGSISEGMSRAQTFCNNILNNNSLYQINILVLT
jgi:hypothetical protein